MRKLLAIAALAALGVSTAAAQSSWTAELGIQGGFAKVKPAGTGANDAINLFDIPGGSFLYSTLGGAALYAIVPWHNKLAIEAQLGGAHLSTGSGEIDVARVGLRGDYALSPQLYAAAGGTVHYIQGLSREHMQLGIHAALGYRKKLTNSINARLEANVTAFNKKALGAFDVYAVQLGISSAIGAGKGGTTRARSAKSSWEPAIGISAGYASMHVVGTANSIDGVFFPGAGGDLLLLAPVATAPTMFVIIPMGQKLALEPGLDFHNVSQTGSSRRTINVGARLDYAVSGNWYAAAGGHMLNYKPPSGSSGSTNGLDLAWGYRFHLAGAFDGRFETSYSLNGKSTKLAIPPINTLSFTFGALMPLK